MPTPRSQQICLEATPYYHCVSRCVRKAYLCGFDLITKTSYEHRRAWLEEELLKQAGVFAIDIAAYAIMSNHYHVVLHINKAKADAWDLNEVIERWHTLYKGNALSQRYSAGESLLEVELEVLNERAQKWRKRLMKISWFMGRLNEKISRQANYEEGCTGHFWEGRFKSQALLDEKALVACLAYVDLNPVRAKMAKTPEQSTHTSIKKRAEKAKKSQAINHPNHQVKSLMPFVGNPRIDMPVGLPFKLTEYLELVELTGRVIRDDKRGHIDSNIPPILQRLGIEAKNWMELTTKFEDKFKDLVGSPSILDDAIALLDRKRRPNVQNCKSLLS
jgi:REP element-mobilizing transposase RayT